MASAVRDGVVARRTRDATGANALADANAHTRTVVPAMCNEAMLRFAGIDHTRDLEVIKFGRKRLLIAGKRKNSFFNKKI